MEDWIIENHSTEVHAFHMHQIHFLTLEQNGLPFPDPGVRDTIVVPYWDGVGTTYPSVKVIMDFRDPEITGTFLYHCHILDHEDGGMMAKIEVLPASKWQDPDTATGGLAAGTGNRPLVNLAHERAILPVHGKRPCAPPRCERQLCFGSRMPPPHGATARRGDPDARGSNPSAPTRFHSLTLFSNVQLHVGSHSVLVSC